MKLWEKGYTTEQLIEDFTIGDDYKLDMDLAKYDVIASGAHAQMLNKIGIIDDKELSDILNEFDKIRKSIENGSFIIEKHFEDVHTKLEFLLTESLGETGKKIHTGRSRNDQVLVALQLYIKDEIRTIVELTETLFNTLLDLSEKHKDILIPGYTHMQIAMPSSFGLWFGAYAESLVDDLHVLYGAYKLTNQNPLGSAAGYGTSFPIDRQLTTDLLEFEDLKYNVVAAQMSRGKIERTLASGISSIASTLSKMAMDACLYSGQNFGFFSFPDTLTTGSSIMPHKKNLDVFELVRGNCNRIQSLPATLTMITNNLSSGYHRDFQLLKASLLPEMNMIKTCIHITDYMLQHIIVNTGITDDDKYRYLFTVEAVNEKVNQGQSFREAYAQIAKDIQHGTYEPVREIEHTHIGSIGNLCNEKIREKFNAALQVFNE